MNTEKSLNRFSLTIRRIVHIFSVELMLEGANLFLARQAQIDIFQNSADFLFVRL